MGIWNATSQFSGDAQYIINGWLGGWKAQPIVMPIEPWWRPGDLTHVQPGAKLISRINVPIHSPGLQPFNGSFSFDENTGLYIQVQRATWQKGTKANLFRMAEFDVSAFDMAPSTMAVEIGNNPGNVLVAMLNGAYSGTPRDAAGNELPDEFKLICRDQIYGGNVAVLSSGTLKPVNPARPDLFTGDTWYNCHQNLDITAPNILTVLKNQQTRKAMNGVELGIGDEGVEMWVPYGSKEDARVLVEVMRELAMSGVREVDLTTYQVDTGGSPQTNQQVIYGSQTNPVFGRVRVKAIHGLRSDLWMIVSPRPVPRPEFGLFIYAHGGSIGEYKIQDNPMSLLADTVPHIATFVWDQKSPLFFGSTGAGSAGDIGITNIVNEGFAFVSGLLADWCFTGAAS